MNNKYDLERYVHEQRFIYEDVINELKSGKKKSHWMWFMFPQIDGLGSSSMTKEFAIKSIEEAREYLRHSVLGERLINCTTTVVSLNGCTAEEIFGYPDYLKFRSCMTLFSEIAEDVNIFKDALSRYYDNQSDEITLRILKKMRNAKLTN